MVFAARHSLLEQPAHDRRLVINLPFETGDQQIEQTLCNKPEEHLLSIGGNALIRCITKCVARTGKVAPRSLRISRLCASTGPRGAGAGRWRAATCRPIRPVPEPFARRNARAHRRDGRGVGGFARAPDLPSRQVWRNVAKLAESLSVHRRAPWA